MQRGRGESGCASDGAEDVEGQASGVILAGFLGGDGDSGSQTDAYLFNTKNMTTSRMFNDGMQISTWSNSCRRTSPDRLTALV